MKLHTIIDINSLREVKKHILSRKLKTTCIVSAIVFFILALILFAVKVYFQAAIILVIAFVLFFEIIFFENLLVKKNLKNIRDFTALKRWMEPWNF